MRSRASNGRRGPDAAGVALVVLLGLLAGCGARRGAAPSGSDDEGRVVSGDLQEATGGLIGAWMLSSGDPAMRFPYHYFALHPNGQAYVYQLPPGCQPLQGCEQVLGARWSASGERLSISEADSERRSWTFVYRIEGPNPPAEGTLLVLRSEHRELARYRWTPVE